MHIIALHNNLGSSFFTWTELCAVSEGNPLIASKLMQQCMSEFLLCDGEHGFGGR